MRPLQEGNGEIDAAGREGRTFPGACTHKSRRPDVFCGWLPRCKGKFDVLALVGCSLLSGLLMQSVETAGPDGVREQGPILLIRL